VQNQNEQTILKNASILGAKKALPRPLAGTVTFFQVTFWGFLIGNTRKLLKQLRRKDPENPSLGQEEFVQFFVIIILSNTN